MWVGLRPPGSSLPEAPLPITSQALLPLSGLVTLGCPCPPWPPPGPTPAMQGFRGAMQLLSHGWPKEGVLVTPLPAGAFKDCSCFPEKRTALVKA